MLFFTPVIGDICETSWEPKLVPLFLSSNDLFTVTSVQPCSLPQILMTSVDVVTEHRWLRE